MLRLISVLVAFTPVLFPTVVLADAAEGEKLFGQCAACHQIGENAKHLYGPDLNGVAGRAAGSKDDYEYSSPFNKAVDANLEWDYKSLDAFLATPMKFIPGTKMVFPGVRSEEQRLSIIEYLKEFDENGKRTSSIAVVEEPEEVKVVQPRKLALDFEVPEHGVLHLGRQALEEEVAAWDIDIRPDGAGLPTGSGDALAGEELYEINCASCHGSFGEGTGRWPILAGGDDTLTDERPEKTIGSYWPYLSTVFDYVRRAMPFGNARSLSDDDVYAITAYLLYLNDLAEEDFVLNAENLALIRLPNEPNFIADNRLEEEFRSISEADVCMTDCFDEAARVTQRARVLDVTPDSE